VNDAPVANDNAYSVNEGEALTIAAPGDRDDSARRASDVDRDRWSGNADQDQTRKRNPEETMDTHASTSSYADPGTPPTRSAAT